MVFGQPSMTTAAQVGAFNVIAAANKAESTGFWVKVRDIEYPRWFIKVDAFSNKGHQVTATLDQWMEIFSQHVNRT